MNGRRWLYRHSRFYAAARTVALASTLCVLGRSKVNGVQVNFAFQGTVTDVQCTPTANCDSLFAVHPGDGLNGTLQFEPFAFGQDGHATILAMTLSSATFSAHDLPLLTLDNHNVPGAGLIDGITVECNPLRPCASTTSSISELTVREIRLGLSSQNVAAFSAGEDLADPEFWNRFIFFPPGAALGFGAERRFFFELVPTADTRFHSIVIQGTVGSMSIVPEPCLQRMLLANMLCVACITRMRR